MSLLQEIESYGLADCAYNRKLIHHERRINRLLKINLPAFNDIQQDEANRENENWKDYTSEHARKSVFFINWCIVWGEVNRRGELAGLLLQSN